MAEFTRWQFIREMRNSRRAWGIGVLYASLSAYSTLATYYPKLATYIPVWPWYVNVIGFLVVVLVAIFEGAYRQGRSLWTLTDEGQISQRILRLAGHLGTLPVHRQELDVTPLALCVGTTIGSPPAIFVKLNIWAKNDVNLLSPTIRVKTDDGSYDASPLTNLSEWILVEDVIDEHHRKNYRDTNLESTSLLKEIHSGIFREGHHQGKWIGAELPTAFVRIEEVRSVTLAFHDKHGVAKKDTFTCADWPQTSYRIVDAAFRRP